MEQKYLLNEHFADNGEHSHWSLIDAKTGIAVWEEGDDDHEHAEIFSRYGHLKSRIGTLGYNTFIHSIEVEEYRAWLRNDRYKHRLDWFEKQYPNGLFYEEEGVKYGVSLETKKFLAEADAAYTPSPAQPPVNEELLGFLEIEIEKANKNGKDCNLKDGDLNRAQAWYSAAEAFSIVKNKITELSNTPHGHESNIINCPSCNAVWDLSRHNSCQCGATLVTKASPAKAEQEGPTQASLMLDELCELVFNDRLYGTSAGVSGRPHDPDPEISKVKRKILDLISTTPPVKEVAYDELWDEFSEYIDDDIDSLSIFAGRTVLTEAQYNKLVAKLKAAPVKEAGQPVSQDDHEKEIMMQAFDKVREIFERRSWIMEGRGPYAYNDDEYRKEVSYLYDEWEVIRKDTWANIKSKSFEYRKQIIKQYLSESRQQPAGESAGAWRRITTIESLPPEDKYRETKKYAVRFQMSDMNEKNPELHFNWLTRDEIDEECQGCDWFEWLDESQNNKP